MSQKLYGFRHLAPEYDHRYMRYKIINVLIHAVFLIAALVIYFQDKKNYPLCNTNYPKANGKADFHDVGKNFRAAMILLIIYHSIELASFVFDIAFKQRFGLRALLHCNHCFGLVLYIYIQIVFFSRVGKICRGSLTAMKDNKTPHFLKAEIILFYL